MRDGDLRNIFKKNLPQFHWQPIELGAGGVGCLDANFCWNSIEGWIEYKKLQKNRIDLRPEQIGWVLQRIRHGGLVKVAVRLQEPGIDSLLLFDGSMVTDFTSKNLNDNYHLVQSSYHGSPRNWNWDDIKVAITTKGTQPP